MKRKERNKKTNEDPDTTAMLNIKVFFVIFFLIIQSRKRKRDGQMEVTSQL